MSAVPNPVVFGQPVILTATVTNAATGATPTGSVQFFDNNVLLGNGSARTGSGASAVSTFPTSSLPAGPQSITAVFTGTGSFSHSTSPAYTENVDVLITTTGVSSSLNPSTFGGAVTFTATVTNTTTGATPTGSVQFFDNNVLLGNGSALTGSGASAVSTFPTSSLPAGPQSITAVFTGTGIFPNMHQPRIHRKRGRTHHDQRVLVAQSIDLRRRGDVHRHQ